MCEMVEDEGGGYIYGGEDTLGAAWKGTKAVWLLVIFDRLWGWQQQQPKRMGCTDAMPSLSFSSPLIIGCGMLFLFPAFFFPAPFLLPGGGVAIDSWTDEE
jgi:hypothetical protein